MKHLFFCIATVLVCTVAPGVSAQGYPDKPVKIITPNSAGTGPDTVMRFVGERLTRLWGRQVIVENRSGANSKLALEAVKRAPPDGYTLLLTDAPPIAIHPHLWKNLPYDPSKDFEPIATLFRTYYFVTVPANTRWKTVGDLIADAKAKPGTLTYGSTGVGSNLHLGGAMMENAAGVKMTHVPYKESPQMYIAMTTGDINWAVGTASTTQPMFKANKVKYLAVTGPKRSPLFPEVPTMAESGGPAGYELQTWVALFAPSGVPKSIINKVNADVARVLQDPEVRAHLSSVGFEPLVQTPSELQEMARSDSAKFKDLVKAMNISLD